MLMEPKQLKAKLKVEASKNPDKYYPTPKLRELGYTRKKCDCGTYFWTFDNLRKKCGDPNCSGGFLFLQKKYSNIKMDYIAVWKNFSFLFKKFGYTPISRYPVVSRWNPSTNFTIASIAAFQPYVVSGEAEPPANPLVIPQLCLRFSDIDAVGLSGHMVLLSMLGQHAFVPPKYYDINKYFEEIHTWLTKSMGIKKEDIAFHEDAWVGGNSCGHSIEFFSGGLELGNQVYMQYEITDSGLKDLKIKVLDMGQGQERAAWFLAGKGMSYDVTFPTVMKKLYSTTGVKPDSDLIKKFLPYSAYLNVDEVSDIDKVWFDISKKLKVDLNELKDKVQTLAALYSAAEHSRALLVAFTDGALPSNTGGGYNLRNIYRRALSFIEKYGWKIDLFEICKWHADYLKPLFPELQDSLNEVQDILNIEKQKFKNSQYKARSIIYSMLKDKETKITDKALINLYDTYGITPDLVKLESYKVGKTIKIPDNFYAMISELHEKKEQKHATKKEIKLDLNDIPETKALYFDDYGKTEFKAKIVKQIDKYVILDQTYFYPTSGGQLHDTGTIANEQVADVFKQGNVIVHALKEPHKFPVGEEVNCVIDKERRVQLAQHHTTAHIVNAAARRILGRHANQASAYKDIDKGRIDITHYKALTDEELKAIEKVANKIVEEAIPTNLRFMDRTEAEQKYGMTIYQGGVAPGKKLRIVEIPEVDVEACGGTHLKNTSEAGKIKLLKATKISDSIVRIEYVSGKAALVYENKEKNILDEVCKLLDCERKLVPGRAKELFELWKLIVKKGKKIIFKLKSNEKFNLSNKDLLELTASILKTQPDYVINTINRFLKEIKEKTG